MIVNLYELANSATLYQKLDDQGIILRRANAYERHLVVQWVGEHFSPKWVSEVKVAFSRQPVACFIATRDKKILGFACVETTAKGFYGPTGVSEQARGTGIGKALLFRARGLLCGFGCLARFVGARLVLRGGIGGRL